MEIQEIKNRLSLLEVLKHYNLLPDSNNRLICPWHNDKTPSLQIYLNTNTWTCFSSNCSAGSGDQIDMIQKMEALRRGSCTKHEAIVIAKSLIPTGVGEVTKKITEKKQLQPTGSELSRIAVLTRFYKLQQWPTKRGQVAALEYCQSRGLDIKHLALAYSPGSGSQKWTQIANKDLKKSYESYGMMRFKGCVLFAMRNIDDRIVGIYGRKVKDTKAGSPTAVGKHYYLNGPHQGLYPCWPAVETERLILTESIIDAASLSKLEGYSVLGLYGTKGFTKDHVMAIKGMKDLKEIILFMDGDKAGQEAISELIEKIQQACAERSRSTNDRITISKVNTPPDEDANSILVKHGYERLEKLIEQRQLLMPTADKFLSSIEVSSIEKEKVPGKTIKPSLPSSLPADKVGKLNTTNPDFLVYQCPQLLISILGGIKITGLDKLRVTIKIEIKKQTTTTCLPIRESLDLYHGRQVDQLIKRMSEDLQLNHSECMQLISEVTNELELYRSDRLELLQTKKSTTPHQMNEAERKTAMTFLKHPNLMANTSRDIALSGIIGEENNALIGHIIYLSRKRSTPLHVMYLGKSGSGKTYLQEKLAMLIPEEDKKSVTALSDQSLYYLGKQLKWKVLFIEDIEGAENVMYIIRELQTKGWVMKTVVWKDPQGNMESKDVLAEGPVSISSCTTLEKLYEDNANRCILLYIDDSPEQDKRIMDFQKQLSAGLIKKHEQEQVQAKHQNIQRLLKPINIINPYALFIDIPSEVYRPRRSQQLLLGFIETVTFYHQYQRKVITDKGSGQRYIETTIGDIEISFKLLKEVLFTKSDELTNGCRKFLEKLKSIVPTNTTFYTQDIRKQMRLSSTSVHRYIHQLKTNGYIIYKGGNRNRGYEYEITDYKEYEQLKSDIERRLEEILAQIRAHIAKKGKR